MIVLLLVTKNEATLLRENLAHHLEWGFDRIAVADNESTDATRDVVAEFGDAVVSIRFGDFHQRQTFRHRMLHEIDQESGRVEWAAIADTDEFFWSPEPLRSHLDAARAETIAVNFESKLFLPTGADIDHGTVVDRRVYRTSGGNSPLHTSYTAGKSLYRGGWLRSLPVDHWCKRHEHLCTDLQPAQVESGAAIVHHYMIQDEDQFVEKVVRLIEWAKPPAGLRAALKWRATPKAKRPLPHWTEPWKKVWWDVYQREGVAGVRAYYRDVYVIPAGAVEGHLASGALVHDDGLARARSARRASARRGDRASARRGHRASARRGDRGSGERA